MHKRRVRWLEIVRICAFVRVLQSMLAFPGVDKRLKMREKYTHGKRHKTDTSGL